MPRIRIAGDEYEFDGQGLRKVHDPKRYRAPPNPISAPPYDPSWDRKLEEIGRRIGRSLRFYWMKENRIWSIQQLEPNGRGWETSCANYDENGQWDGNQYPYRPIDQRFLDEFRESDLKQTVGTGDLSKDHAIHDKAAGERAVKNKEDADRNMEEMLELIGTGGDPRRFARLLQHEDMHAGPGVRYTEFFPGANLTKE